MEEDYYFSDGHCNDYGIDSHIDEGFAKDVLDEDAEAHLSSPASQVITKESLLAAQGTVMEKGYICYFLFEHSPQQMSDSSPSGLFLYELDTDSIEADYLSPVELKTSYKPLWEPIFRFVPAKYPKGMGCGALEGKLYFFGGYFPHQINAPKDSPLEYSEKIYILDLTRIGAGRTEETIEKDVMEIRDSKFIKKSNPLVVTAKGKLYVLPRNFGAECEIRPSIQSYEPSQDKWENYDIFELLKRDSAFSCHPTASALYDVMSHCVHDDNIIIVLYAGAYSLNVDTGKLRLIGKHTYTPAAIPFRGLAAVADGCFFGLEFNYVLGYTNFPFGILSSKSPIPRPVIPAVLAHECPCRFSHSSVSGLVIQLADLKETKLLVVRSGVKATFHPTNIREEIYLGFDFLCIEKDDKGSPFCSRSHSISYTTEKDEKEYHGCIVACFPMRKMTGTKNIVWNQCSLRSSTSASKHSGRNKAVTKKEKDGRHLRVHKKKEMYQ